MTLILDTNVLFAALDRGDKHHSPCFELVANVTEARLIPGPVVVELDHFIRTRLHALAHAAFLRDLTDGAFFVEELLPEDYRRVREICAAYSDADIGVVDASIIAIAERLNEPKVATLDHRHFRMIRPRHVDALQLLPAI